MTEEVPIEPIGIFSYNVMRPTKDGQPRYDKRKPLRKVELERRGGLICPLCGDPIAPSDKSVDHIVPLSKGGANELNNLQLTHKVCNNVKSDITDKDKMLRALFKRHRMLTIQLANQASTLRRQQQTMKDRLNKINNLKYKLRTLKERK